MNLQLSKITTVEAKIELVTGMHIGAGSDVMHIGGIDNPVAKHPVTYIPYIPGSSIKGKVRSLLEWRAGVVAITKGAPLELNHLDKFKGEQRVQAENILKLFGASGDVSAAEAADLIGPTRCSFWDASLSQEWIGVVNELGVPMTEDKTENSIDRISSTAKNPRHTERVPSGASFEFKLIVKHLMEGDEGLIDTLKQGLKLLEFEGLGGSGSRGYGKIRFTELMMDGQVVNDFAELDPFK